MENVIKTARDIAEEWNLIAILAVCMSLTAMVQIVSALISVLLTALAFYTTIKSKKQGRKLSIIAGIITVIDIVLCIQNGFWKIFAPDYVMVSIGLALLAFLFIFIVMFTFRAFKKSDNGTNGLEFENAGWVPKYGRHLFNILPLGWSKTKMIVVDSRNGIPYYVEQTKGTFSDSYSYLAEELSWKEVRRFAHESPEKGISIRFADVDEDNWFKYVKKR